MIISSGKISSDIIDNYSKRNFRRIKTHFLLHKHTDKGLLDTLDRAITAFLEADKNVISKDTLTGINEYTPYGIEFGVTFYVDAKSKLEYSAQQHRLLSGIAQIIKDNGVEQVIVHSSLIS